jgi:ADP-ribose pyrophosphatase YjhB (NUDIX family)
LTTADPSVPRWLTWAREIQALSQTGIHYSENEYNRQRYMRLMEIAAEIIQDYSGVPKNELNQAFLDQKGYATPKVDVRAAVFRDQKLLMVRERADNRWTLPGGWADVGDVPSQAAEREVREESGFHVRARRLIGVYDANRSGSLELFHAFKVIFLCDLLDGEAQPSLETSEVAFFAENEMPTELSGQRTRPRHIVDAFTALHDPNCPAVFD